MLMVCRKIEPRLIKGDPELPSVMFDVRGLQGNVGAATDRLHHKTTALASMFGQSM
jgi:hypothetical protein